MRAGFFKATFVATLMCAVMQCEAVAQSRIPESSAPAQVRGATEIDARRTLYAYAECLVASNYAQVDRGLALRSTPDEAVDPAALIAAEDCLADGSLRMSPSAFRGALYERAYLRHRRATPLPDYAALPELDYAQYYAPAANGEPNPFMLRAMVGDCVVRAAPQLVDDMLRTELGSDDEQRSVAQLVPFLGPCFPANQTVRVTRILLRMIVAEGAYRLGPWARRSGEQA